MHIILRITLIASVVIVLSLQAISTLRAIRNSRLDYVGPPYDRPTPTKPETWQLDDVRRVHNPIVAHEEEKEPAPRVPADLLRLTGVWIDFQFAHFELLNESLSFTLCRGDGVRFLDVSSWQVRDFPELGGWTLKEVHSDGVRFENGDLQSEMKIATLDSPNQSTIQRGVKRTD